MSNNQKHWLSNLESKDGAKLIAQLSTNLDKEAQQKYITLGCVLSSYPKLDTEKAITYLKEWGYWNGD